MLLVLYLVLLAGTALYLARRFRGRTVEGLIRRPPEGSDIRLIVNSLGYIEHELIKHRIPVLRSLFAKRRWGAEDWPLLERTVGHGETSLLAELDGYYNGIQRGAGRTLVNFRKDPAFRRARAAIQRIQRAGEEWVQERPAPGPDPRGRESLDAAAEWLASDFRRYLLELRRSVFRCPVRQPTLERNARRALSETAGQIQLSLALPPAHCVAHILPSDLDLVVRNLVRNAAAAPRPKGVGAKVHVEVEEALEETGEESVLIRIHDNSPARLTREQIYGRQANRGLGLVTSALNRHQAAVVCRPSARQGFEKTLEVRLNRSLHEPDPGALAAGGQGRVGMLAAALLVVGHCLLLAFVVVPFVVAEPIAWPARRTPPACTTSGSDVVCSTLDGQGQPLRDPLVFELNQVGRGALVGQTGPECLKVSLVDRGLRVDPRPCFDSGDYEPSAILTVESPWFARSARLRLDFRANADELLELGRGLVLVEDFDRAGPVFAHLLSLAPSRLSQEQRLESHWWRGTSAVLRGRGQDERACDLLAVTRQSVDALESALASAAPSSWRPRSAYLGALGEVWLAHDLDEGIDLLREIASMEPADRSVQSARYLLAIIAATRTDVVPQEELERHLTRLDRSHRRPSVVAVGQSATLVLEVHGAWLDIPIPEALCAFGSYFADTHLPPDLRRTTALHCGGQLPHPAVAEALARTAGELRHMVARECR